MSQCQGLKLLRQALSELGGTGYFEEWLKQEKLSVPSYDCELQQAYKSLGRMCELSDIVCPWVEKRNRIPSDVQAAVKEIMQYVEQVRP